MRHLLLRMALAAGLMFGAVSCGQPSITAQINTPGPGCNLLDGLREHIISTSVNNLGGDYPAVDDSAAYYDYLYSPSGAKIGTVYGRLSIFRRTAAGHYLAQAEETIDLPAGTIVSQGIFDETLSADGKWQYLPATGTSGSYVGKLGKRSFQVIKAGLSLNANIDLCPPTRLG
jgi:hypothetical protein